MRIERTRKGKPALWVGGGGMTNRVKGRFVVSPNGELPPALFIRRSGHLSCSLEQALVPLAVGSLIINISTSRAELNSLLEPDYPAPTGITGHRVIAIRDDEAMLEEATEEAILWLSAKGRKVIEAISTYHNRNGLPFTKEG